MKFAAGLAVVSIALITHLCVVYGLAAICPAAVAGLFVGSLVVITCRSHWLVIMGGTFLGLLGGSLVAQPWFLNSTLADVTNTVIYVGLGGLSAGLTGFFLGRWRISEKSHGYLAMATVLVTLSLMWSTTLVYNQGAFTPGEPTVDAWLAKSPELGKTPTDRDLYLRLFYDTHNGVPYYDAYARIYQSDPLGEYRLPNGIPGYRLPTLFYFWQLLPGHGDVLPLAFLGFATLAVCSAFAIGAQLAKPGLAALAACRTQPFKIYCQESA